MYPNDEPPFIFVYNMCDVLTEMMNSTNYQVYDVEVGGVDIEQLIIDYKNNII